MEDVPKVILLGATIEKGDFWHQSIEKIRNCEKNRSSFFLFSVKTEKVSQDSLFENRICFTITTTRKRSDLYGKISSN